VHDVVAQEQDQVRLGGVGPADDLAQLGRVVPRRAGVQVGEECDAQTVVLLRPARDLQALGAQPQRSRLEPEGPQAEEREEDRRRGAEEPEGRLQGAAPLSGRT
jgi:hypothetical protein